MKEPIRALVAIGIMLIIVIIIEIILLRDKGKKK